MQALDQQSDWIKRIAALAALVVTLYSVFNSMISPVLQRVEDLETEVAKRREAVINLREHVHELEIEIQRRLTYLETTGDQ